MIIKTLETVVLWLVERFPRWPEVNFLMLVILVFFTVYFLYTLADYSNNYAKRKNKEDTNFKQLAKMSFKFLLISILATVLAGLNLLAGILLYLFVALTVFEIFFMLAKELSPLVKDFIEGLSNFVKILLNKI